MHILIAQQERVHNLINLQDVAEILNYIYCVIGWYLRGRSVEWWRNLFSIKLMLLFMFLMFFAYVDVHIASLVWSIPTGRSLSFTKHYNSALSAEKVGKLSHSVVSFCVECNSLDKNNMNIFILYSKYLESKVNRRNSFHIRMKVFSLLITVPS